MIWVVHHKLVWFSLRFRFHQRDILGLYTVTTYPFSNGLVVASSWHQSALSRKWNPWHHKVVAITAAHNEQACIFWIQMRPGYFMIYSLWCEGIFFDSIYVNDFTGSAADQEHFLDFYFNLLYLSFWIDIIHHPSIKLEPHLNQLNFLLWILKYIMWPHLL